MMSRLFRLLADRDPRLPPLVALLLVVFVCIEGWLFVLKKPFTEYQRLAATGHMLGQALSARGGPSTEIEMLERDNKALSDRIDGEMHLAGARDRVVVSLLEILDSSSRAAGLTLMGVHPGEVKTAAGFDQLTYDVTVAAPYPALANWMLNLNERLGHRGSITELDVRPDSGDARMKASLRLSMYLPTRAGAGK
jgi:Tfp pilus assembly protein PilO